jgi:DNA polymerase zeta
VSYNRNAYDRRSAFVAHITLVKGIPFYGYHVGYRFFFKIYLLNPLYVTRLADLLLQGAVMKRPLQPYESHLQYIPQWMCDYSLYGCAYMSCSKFKFRSPVPEYLELSDLSYRWHDRSIRLDWITEESVLPKQSHCSLEVDICVQDILNRFDTRERPLHHDFTELWRQVISSERLVPSMAGLWQDETRRRKKRLGLEDPESNPFGQEDLVSMSADPRNQSDGSWIHEEEYREMVSQIAAEEKRRADGKDVSFENYLDKNPLEDNVKTALESIEDFFPDKLEQSRFEMYQSQKDGVQGDAEIHVNENAARSPEPVDEPDYSDEDYDEGDDPQDDDPENGVFDMNFQDLPQPDISGSRHIARDGVVDEPEHEHNDVYESIGGLQNQLNHDAGYGFDINKRNANSSEKRPLFEDTDLEYPNKKPKNLEGFQRHSKSMPTRNLAHATDIRDEGGNEKAAADDHDAHVQPSSQQKHTSQKSAHGMAGSQNRLNFPIVKDPMDPMTILRFSQDGGQSSKATPDDASTMGKSSAVKAAVETAGDETARKSSQPFSSFPADMESSFCDTQAPELLSNTRSNFNIPSNKRICCLRFSSPTPSEVSSTLGDYGYPSVIYQKAYYSDENDVPERPREYAGREFRLESNTLRYLPDFDPTGRSPAILGERPGASKSRDCQETAEQRLLEPSSCRVWEFAPTPPSRSEVVHWFENLESESQGQRMNKNRPEPKAKPNELSQIEGPTQMNDYGFKYSQKAKSTSVEHQTQDMSTMSLEVHVNTREALSPNPEEDEISCLFWCIQSEDEDLHANGRLPNAHVGMIFHGDGDGPEAKIAKAVTVDFERETTELDLINRLVDIVRFHDPDIITGYEVHNSSWGYLMERAKKKYDFDLCDELSRVKSQAHGRFGKDNDRWGFNRTSSIRVTGRHMINIWRAMRSELNLLQYTMENVVFHLLHRRIPHYSFRDLTEWYESGKPRDFMKVVDYYVSRVQMNLEIIESNELVSRTSEQARILGVDFFSVFSRGSQFKVESLMFRIAKPENFMLVSPSRKQVGQQNALECLPLVMEPQSDFYTSPLLVLDFQSLYPSVMIAYNYCYSTFLGRALQWRGRDKMGFTNYERQSRLLELLKDKINISPNGMVYTKPEVRQSLLARMLTEILETRVMVKAGMKMEKDDKALQRLLNNRQLALKLIANVTYGYTSASFSGRMPCSEIADSIVQTGRETLEKAIALIHSIDRWGAEVVYGDTDSLFVYLKGRTREEAFDIGEEIAQAVTEANPRPIKLKFEKVYHPCVLLAKKRYVGFKYEHREQKDPEFDAKGIETVRRDGTPAEQKIEEKALKILFRTSDLSLVKSYFQKQCTKILHGAISIQDFCFAKEVRLGTYSDKGLPPAGALISTRKMLEDPRLEPQYGERVPYVVVSGAPGSRLIDRCVAPETLLKDGSLTLDAEYYITKNLIPPLERIFNLVGANVRQWYEEIPRVQRVRPTESAFPPAAAAGNTRRTLDAYLKSSSCVICRTKLTNSDTHPATENVFASDTPLCATCLQTQPHIALLTAQSRLQQAEKRVVDLHRVCRSCMGVPFGDEVKCDSKDCPVFYSRTRSVADLRRARAVLGPAAEVLGARGDRLDW